MRLLRLSLLSAYFNYLSKNKKKALKFINLGIFLCIFAISTASISFFIERQISIKQTELIYLNITDKDYSRFKSEYQTAMNNYSTLLVFEDNYKVEKEYLAQSKFESQILKDIDFFGPYIYSNMIGVKNFFDDEEFVEFLDPNSQYMKEMITSLESSWDKEHTDRFKKGLNNVNQSFLELKKINTKTYELKKIQNLDDIIFEIVNHEKSNVYNYDEKIFSDYYKIKEFYLDFIFFFEEMLQVISAYKVDGQNQIQKINSEIISLSKKEKNYILGTFIVQFIIFLIIQFFEVNSINFNLLDIKRKNAKKNK